MTWEKIENYEAKHNVKITVSGPTGSRTIRMKKGSKSTMRELTEEEEDRSLLFNDLIAQPLLDEMLRKLNTM